MFFNFEHYDLTNNKEFEFEIWDTHTCIRKVLDPMVVFRQNTSKLDNLHLVFKKASLEGIW